jgi:hypothetical protein
MITLSLSPPPKCLLQGTLVPNPVAAILTAGASGYLLDAVSVCKILNVTFTLFILPTAGAPAAGDTAYFDPFTSSAYLNGNSWYNTTNRPPYHASIMSGMVVPANSILYATTNLANGALIRITGRDLASSATLSWSPLKELYLGRTQLPGSGVYTTVFTATTKTLIESGEALGGSNTHILVRIVESGGTSATRHQISGSLGAAYLSPGTYQNVAGLAGQLLEPGDFIQACTPSSGIAYFRLYGREAL